MNSVTAKKTGKMYFGQDTNWIFRLAALSWKCGRTQRPIQQEQANAVYPALLQQQSQRIAVTCRAVQPAEQCEGFRVRARGGSRGARGAGLGVGQLSAG